VTGRRPVRAIVYGVGAMGSIMARLALDKGVEIVGAIARSPAKVGRDLGEVAALGRETGVIVEADARPALERGADVALVAAASYLSVMAGHFRLCLEHGCNVVTIEEEVVWPWGTAPELAAELDRVGKEHGATLAASGAQDVFWLNLVATLLGASHRIDSVAGRCTWNADDYGPEVAAHVHLGQSREAFERHVAEHGWPDFVARANLEALVAAAGLTPAGVSSSVAPAIAETETWSASLGAIVPAGAVLGVVDAVTVETREGPSFSFEMAGRVYAEGEVDTNEWIVRGEPELRLFNDAVPTRLITCTSAVNRIPDVIAAEPGLVTLDRLPRPRYRHGPLVVEGEGTVAPHRRRGVHSRCGRGGESSR
jgi:4-hydroxy-tetrahydrodipicolinate reductase